MMNWKIIIILLAALGLRLVFLDQSLWLDEAIEWWAVKSFGLRELLTGYMIGDFNPPGHHVLMWFWVRIFGDSEIALRMPSVIFGVGVVWWVYKIANLLRSNLGVRQGWTFAHLTAAMAAVNGLLIYYSQEARMYAMAAFFVAGGMYWFLKMNKTNKTDKTNGTDYAIYCLLLAAALYSHYLTWLVLPFLAIWGLRYVLPVLVTAPWWPMLWRQLQAGMAAAGNPVWAQLSRTNFKNLALVAVKFVTGRVPWPEELWGELMVGGIVLLFWVLVAIGGIRVIRPQRNLTLRRALRARTQRAILRGSDVPADFLTKIRAHPKKLGWALVLWAFGPLILGGIIGWFIPIFSYFRFLFAAPAVMLLFFKVQPLRTQRLNLLTTLAVSGIVGAMGVFSLFYLFNQEFHREDWRGAVGELRRQEENPVVLINPAVKPPFDYYDKGESLVILSDKVQPLRTQRLNLNTTIWYIPYGQPIFEPEDSTRKILESAGYVRTFEKHFRGVTLERWIIQ